MSGGLSHLFEQLCQLGASPAKPALLPALSAWPDDETSQSFRLASARLARLHQLPADMVRANKQIIERGIFTGADFDDHLLTYRLMGHKLHFKNGGKNPEAVVPTKQISEIALSHIAFEMGLNHAVYGLVDQQGEQYWRTFSLRPKSRYTRAIDMAALDDIDLHPEFFTYYPHMYGAMLGMTAFDHWAGNSDRHLKNILVVRGPQPAASMMFGIDLDEIQFGTQALRRGQLNLLAGRSPTQPQMARLHATLDVIETYPAARIAAHLERFAPLAERDYDPAAITRKLVDSQNSIRERMADLLPTECWTQVMQCSSYTVSANKPADGKALRPQAQQPLPALA